MNDLKWHNMLNFELSYKSLTLKHKIVQLLIPSLQRSPHDEKLKEPKIFLACLISTFQNLSTARFQNAKIKYVYVALLNFAKSEFNFPSNA